MTVRLSITLPDNVHSQVVALAQASNISAAALVRMILSDVVPKMASVIDYIGLAAPSPERVAEADAWVRQMQALYADAPDDLRAALGDRRPAPSSPPASDGEDL